MPAGIASPEFVRVGRELDASRGTGGRKNWIHIGSPRAGPKVAAILSVVESCRRLKLRARLFGRGSPRGCQSPDLAPCPAHRWSGLPMPGRVIRIICCERRTGARALPLHYHFTDDGLKFEQFHLRLGEPFAARSILLDAHQSQTLFQHTNLQLRVSAGGSSVVR